MEVELESEWLSNQIELMKIIHGYEIEGINEEIGSIDYLANGDNHDEKLLRVMVDPWFKAVKVDMATTTKIVHSLEEKDFKEVVIIAEKFTESAKRLLREEGIFYISPEMKPQYTVFVLIDAIHKVTHTLCRAKCGRVPTSERDCKGYRDSEYTCPVRRISDNADFHAERIWRSLLMKDFSTLITLLKEMNNSGVN